MTDAAESAPGAILRARGISKNFGPVVALENVFRYSEGRDYWTRRRQRRW
jgi:hypothetical protein